ncbi:MAG: NAD-dependent epimerase/dehydratase family protein [Pseudomonadota bacterium]
MAAWFITGGSGFVGRHLIKTLIARGESVRALARSESSQAIVRKLGATVVAGDLDSIEAMMQGMNGCDFVVHAAAEVQEWGPRDRYQRVNVDGTRNVIDAARRAKVKRLVHIGTEAPFARGKPIVNIDESVPLPETPLPRYPATKAAAEKLVRAANGGGLETVVVRPRLIWGPDDTSILPQLVAAVKDGRFMWINGGRALTSTCHVANVCAGAISAAYRGKAGEAYFLTDGAPVSVREFLTAYIKSGGVDPPDKSLPYGLVWVFASIAEFLWDRLLPGKPPVTRMAIALIGREVTVNDAKARREMAYDNVISRADGLKALLAA